MSTTNMKYFSKARNLTDKITPALHKKVTNFLVLKGIPEEFNDKWSIIDINDSLVMVHYNENFNPYDSTHECLSKLRGIVIDTNTGLFLTHSYGYVEEIITNSLISEENDKYSFLNNKGEITSFDKSKVKFAVGYESTNLKFIKHNGKVYCVTSTRIDGSKSRWGDSKIFLSEFLRLSNINIENLFGSEKYSPYVYSFLLVGQSDLASTLHENRVIYLGYKKLWDTEVYAKCPSDPYYFDGEIKAYPPLQFKNEEQDVISVNTYDRNMIEQKYISREIVNKLLFPEHFAEKISQRTNNGNNREIFIKYKNNGEVENVYWLNSYMIENMYILPEFTLGNFIILFYEEKLIKIVSPAYKYRSSVVGFDLSRYHRFVYTLQSFNTGCIPKTSIIPILKADGTQYDLNSKYEFTQMWLQILYNCVAPSKREEILTFHKKYYYDLKNLIKFIIKVNTLTEEEIKLVHPLSINRMKQILNKTVSKIKDNNEKILYDTLKIQLLNFESPDSFYRLLKQVEKFYSRDI